MNENVDSIIEGNGFVNWVNGRVDGNAIIDCVFV